MNFKEWRFIMTLLRDQVKDAILGIENDEQKWHDKTLLDVAGAAAAAVKPQIDALTAQVKTLSDAAAAGSTDDVLVARVATLESEAATHEAEQKSLSDSQVALQGTVDDVSGAVADFFAQLKAGTPMADAAATLAAATSEAAPAVAAAASDAATTAAAAPAVDAGADATKSDAGTADGANAAGSTGTADGSAPSGAKS